MVLKSPRLMPRLSSRNCGMVWYLANSACQAASSSGGTTPVTGRHSTIERPDSVSRVAPPTTSVATINAATTSSHSRTARVFRARMALVMRDHSLAEDGADHIVMRPPSQSTSTHPMPIRLRKLMGAVALIVLVTVWALIAMALAQSPAIKANGVVEVIYYVVAGLGWVLPAMPLIRWMSRADDRRRRTEDGR